MRIPHLCIFFFFLCFLSLDAEETALIVCEHGQEKLEWDSTFIRHARHSIEISGIYFHGEVAQRILSEIGERLALVPELSVQLLLTPTNAEREDLERVAELRAAYPDRFSCQYTAMVGSLLPKVKGIDLHVKLCVVDATYFSIGGTNLTEYEYVDGSYTPPRSTGRKNPLVQRVAAGYRDQNVVGRGPIAQEMHRQFVALFALWRQYNETHQFDPYLDHFLDLAGISHTFSEKWQPGNYISSFDTSPRLLHVEESQVRLLVGGPHQRRNAISEAYIELIRQAEREICIENLFFYPAEEIFAALQEAVHRGVEVTVITNGIGQGAPDQNSHYVWANRLSYTPLFYGKSFALWEYFSVKGKDPYPNTQIYEYGVADVTLHKKVMVVDGRFVLVGSYNLGKKSHEADYEMVLFLDSREAAAETKKIFLKDKALSREISSQQALSWYFDPAIAYLGTMQRLLGTII